MPTVFAFTKSPEKKRALKQLEKFDIRESMKRKQAEAKLQSRVLDGDGENDMVVCEDNSNVRDACCQTDLSSDDICALMNDCQALRNENMDLKDARRPMSSELFAENAYTKDEKVTTVTGLKNVHVLMALFNVMHPFLKDTSLTCFQQLIITLMRLKLNLPLQFLSYLVGVHTSTISRVFNTTIDKLNDLIVPASVVWPAREEVQVSLPMCFRKEFGNCMAIIDCFEIFIEKSKDFQARAKTFSQYKSHNTMKYLIGITPQGVISFISKGWGGRTPDPHITANSGFLDHLLPDDLILADRGFPINEQVGLYCARVITPAFTRGKKQLSAIDVEDSRRVASVRIHVERVIGLARCKYRMLQGPVLITLL